MTWTETTSASTPGWGDSGGVSSPSWNVVSAASVIGNVSRFIQAAPREGAQGGVDFFNVISTRAPWSVASAYPVSISSLSRNDPA